MNHKNNLVVCLALAVCLLLSSVTVMAQESKSAVVNDWSRLSSIASGSRLSAKLKNGQAVNGELAELLMPCCRSRSGQVCRAKTRRRVQRFRDKKEVGREIDFDRF